MRRYDFDDNRNEDEDPDDDFEKNHDDEDGEDDDFLDEKDLYHEEDMIKELEISFQENQNKTNTIEQSIKICSHSFFWRFYSYETKLKMIEDCYKRLLDLGS